MTSLPGRACVQPEGIMNITLSRAGATVATAAVAAALALAPTAAQAAPTPQASSAADWLAAQVPSDTHLFASVYGPGEFDSFVDYGLNLDLQHALDTFGDTATADQVYGAVVADTAAYTDAWGTRYSGNMGKLATYVALHGDDPTAIDDRDLIAELAELMVTEGAEQGRLKDSPDGEYQSANTVGQAWGVRAFHAADSEDVDPAADFLVDQQCTDGGFRLFQKGDGCASSVDATTFAVIALREAGGHDAAVADARTYLNSEQADDGSLSESGAANSNSTGLAAVVLSSLGDAAAATAAADWIVPLQATSSTSGLEDEAGAIAFDSSAFGQGADGISDVERDQWVRTSVQAIHALSFASQAEPEPEPGPVASIKLKVSDAKPAQGDTITITATGKDADGRSTGDVSDELNLESSVESDTIKDNTVTFNTASPHTITATHGDDGPTASITIQVTPSAEESPASESGGTTDPVSSANGTLPDTGSSVETWQLLAAAALLVTGAGLVLTGRGRRAPFAPSHARR